MNKVETILEAALRLFARDGFERATVQDIADEAGVAAGTIIYHFKTKNNLLFVVIREILRKLIQETERKLGKKKSKLEEVELFVKVFFEYFQNNIDALLTYTKSNPFIVLDTSLHPNIDIGIFLQRYCSILGNVVRSGLESREFVAVQAETFSYMSVLMLFSTASTGIISSNLKTLEKEALAMIRSRLLVGDGV